MKKTGEKKRVGGRNVYIYKERNERANGAEDWIADTHVTF